MRIEIRLLDADEGMASDMAQSLNVLSGELGGVMLPYRDAQMLDRLLTARISLERTNEDWCQDVITAIRSAIVEIQNGNKLLAIKAVRDRLKINLITAKKLVDVICEVKG